jgi:threonine/homoserine/homoserine lactone efflux protein
VSLAFLLTSLVIVAMPGTGALITLSAGLSRGAGAGIVAAFGCTLGIVPHLVAAVTGTAALLRASGVAFDALRIAGVLYLLFMAVMTWRDKSDLVVQDEQPARSSARVIGSAMLANVLNPKLTIFFFAFLPQFVPPHAPHELARLLLLSGVDLSPGDRSVAYERFPRPREWTGREPIAREAQQAYAGADHPQVAGG